MNRGKAREGTDGSITAFPSTFGLRASFARYDLKL
jgi:hypothetical protein